MAQIGINHTFSGYAGSLIYVLYKATAPLVEVDRSAALAFPTDSVVTFANLDPVVYTLKAYQSNDGTTLNTLLRTWSIDASIGGGESNIQFITFVVGDGENVGDGVNISPAHEDDSYLNELLAASDVIDFRVNKQGFGSMSFRTQIEKISGGGFKYKNQDRFQQNEEYEITVYKKAVVQSAPAKQFDGTFELTTNITFSAAHKNKLIWANFETAKVGIITLNALSSYSNDTFLHLTTHAGNQNNVKIVLSGTDKVWFRGAEVDEIILGKGEEIKIYFDDGKAFALNPIGGWDVIGTPRWGYVEQLNEFPLSGGKYLFSEWPRAEKFINELPPSAVVSYTQWAASQDVDEAGNTVTVYPWKGLFAVSNDGLEFQVPDFRDMTIHTLKYFDATADGDRLTQGPGGFAHQQVLKHGHLVATTGNQSSVNPGRTLQRSSAAPVPGDTGKGEAPGYIIEVGGTKQRLDNYGLPAFIKI